MAVFLVILAVLCLIVAWFLAATRFVENVAYTEQTLYTLGLWSRSEVEDYVDAIRIPWYVWPWYEVSLTVVPDER